MIVWFNCKISDIRLNPQPRYNLRNDNRFDIARYSFASFTSLEPLVSKFIFNLEMADGHAGQESEMEAWLRSIFPEDKLVMYWHRCNNIAQWREKQQEFNSIDDDLIFPAGNEDHIFTDSTIEVFKECLENLARCPVGTVVSTSHWPENIRAAYGLGGVLVNKNCAVYTMGNNDALRVMHKGFFDWYVDQIKDENKLIFRTEHWNDVVLPSNTMLVPTKEQFRHFDGYAHVKIGPGIAPPLEIPTKFFQGMVIRYGFRDRDPDCVNINPLLPLHTVDPQGTDYKFTLSDFPLFWKNHVKDVIVADGIDPTAMALARDQHILDMSRVDIDWHHIGKKFDDTNWPPASWIQPHLMQLIAKDPQVEVSMPKSFGSSLSSC